jgi:hypothetical protein
MSPPPIDLLSRANDRRLHNQTAAAGPDLEFTTDPTQWSYAVSVPIEIPPAPGPGLEPYVEAVVSTIDGSVGVGIMDQRLQNFVSSEVDAHATGKAVRVELQPTVTEARAYLMVRNTAPGGIRSRFRLLGATLQFRARDRRLLAPKECPEIPLQITGPPRASGTFDVLISHSSRVWNAAQCDRGYLASRYARADRLKDVPPFDSLPPNAAPYHGLLSVLRLDLRPGIATSEVRHHYVSPEKVVHVAVAGNNLVVCCDSGVALFSGVEPADVGRVDSSHVERITDRWFGGLHTVIPVDDTTCLISSSGADAILWLDVSRKAVTQRWRLPASRYGVNYALDDSMSLVDHYIPNDLQLGHLNCAAPDGRGGVFMSVLGQGDIAHLSASGEWTLLTSGHVGCHGVRYDAHDDSVYFSDSCSGRLMRVDRERQVTVLFDAESRWLHDAVHVIDGLFLMTLGDHNRLVLADTRRGVRVADWDFAAVGGSIQFLSVVDSRR